MTNKSFRSAASVRGIGRLGSAFITMRWFGLAQVYIIFSSNEYIQVYSSNRSPQRQHSRINQQFF